MDVRERPHRHSAAVVSPRAPRRPAARIDAVTTEVPAAAYTFLLFGAIEVATPAGVIGARGFASRKSKQLCQLLAGAGGSGVTKDEVIDALWGERLPKDPGATVDHTVSLLRSTLRSADGLQPIISERGRYRIDLAVADIDLVRFDRLLEQSAAADPVRAYELLLDAVRLARGEVLADEPYAPWAAPLRDRYRVRVERALLEVARHALADDHPDVALDTAERARRASATVLEEGYALSASALTRLGRRQEARVVLAELEQRLRSEHGVGLSPESELVRSINDAPPGQPTAPPVATRLPAPIDVLPLVGRDAELGVFDDLLSGRRPAGCRMMVVEGAPGIGTSRFLTAASERAARSGWSVLELPCSPDDRDLPLLYVTRLLRYLTSSSGGSAAACATDSPAAVFGRLADLIDRRGPTVLVVDDAHWADDASFAVLGSLAQPGGITSAWIVLGRRADAVNGDAAVHHTRHERIELGPLERAAVDALPIDGAWEETGGHPGLLSGCVDADRHGGVLPPTGLATLLDWVDCCGPTSRAVLAAAASLHQPFEVRDLAERLGVTRESAGALLRRASRAHLVDDPDVHVRIRFRSELVRRALVSPSHRPVR